MPEDNNKVYTPGHSGFSQAWRFFRHCCFRYGWYPVLVAPVVTAACLFDLYSSFGCEFLEVDVGFTPSNIGWNHSSAVLGLFRYKDTSILGGDTLENRIFDGCHAFPEKFSEFFIDGDKTWTVAQIMSYISGIAGMVATLMAWLMVLTPLPVCFFWPGVLLPAVMMGFLAEGSKFLFFDTQLCHGHVWYPIGEQNIFPRTAESCSLGSTGTYAIAAGCCFLVSLLMVCLKAPKKRDLQDEYGKMEDAFENYDNNMSSVKSGGIDDVSMPSYKIENDGGETVVPFSTSPPVDAVLGSSITDTDSESPSTTYAPSISPNEEHSNSSKPWREVIVGSSDPQLKQTEGSINTKDDIERGEIDESRDDFISSVVSKPVFEARSAEVGEEEIVESSKVSKTRVAKIKSMERIRQCYSKDLIDSCMADLEKSFGKNEMLELEIFQDEVSTNASF